MCLTTRKNKVEQQGINPEKALLVSGIGVRFPFLSYRASAKCLAYILDAELLNIYMVDILKNV